MKQILNFLLIFICIINVNRCSGQQPERSKSDWIADLDYLAKQLPMKHANLFHTLSKEDFERDVADLRHAIPQMTDNRIMTELMRIVASVNDGHTDLTPRYRQYPIRFDYFENVLYVIAATEENMDVIGGNLIKVGSLEIHQVVEKLVPLVDRDNDIEILRKVPVFLTMAEVLNGQGIIDDMERANFTIRTESGKELMITLKPAEPDVSPQLISARAKAKSPIPMYMQNVQKNYWFTYMAEKRTLYFQFNVCNDQKGEKSIAAFAKELFAFVDKNEIDYFIIDLRLNPGGNFKKAKSLLEDIRNNKKINNRGTLFVLTGRHTGSAATVFGAQLKVSTQAVFIGEVSRSNPNLTYNAERFHLPKSKLWVGYTASFHHPFPELGKTLPVDVPLENSFEDFRTGNDKFLEFVWSYGKM